MTDLMLLRQLAMTANEAKALVMAGKVIVNDQRAVKGGDLVPEDSS